MTHHSSLGAASRRAPSAAVVLLVALACSRAVRPTETAALAKSSAVTSGAEVELVVAATTDTHGRLRSWDYYANNPEPQRGLTRIATIVDSLRAANPGRVLLVDSGDLLQGNPLTYVAARVDSSSRAPHPVAAAMNAMAYDAAAIGNHEFNYGLATLRRMIHDAHFPMLAANAFTPAGTHAFESWKMIDREGVKVAVVGGTTPGANLWDRDNLAGRSEERRVGKECRSRWS